MTYIGAAKICIFHLRGIRRNGCEKLKNKNNFLKKRIFVIIYRVLFINRVKIVRRIGF